MCTFESVFVWLTGSTIYFSLAGSEFQNMLSRIQICILWHLFIQIHNFTIMYTLFLASLILSRTNTARCLKSHILPIHRTSFGCCSRCHRKYQLLLTNGSNRSRAENGRREDQRDTFYRLITIEAKKKHCQSIAFALIVVPMLFH